MNWQQFHGFESHPLRIFIKIKNEKQIEWKEILNSNIIESSSKIYKNEWKSGDYLWLYDIVIIRKSKEVMSWVYNYFKKLLKTNESISWLRLDKNNKVYRVAKKYKREFHN